MSNDSLSANPLTDFYAYADSQNADREAAFFHRATATRTSTAARLLLGQLIFQLLLQFTRLGGEFEYRAAVEP